MSTTSQGLTVLALLSIVPAGVGAQEENELDRFMARVLQQQGETPRAVWTTCLTSGRRVA